MKDLCQYPACPKKAVNGKYCSKQHSPYGLAFSNKKESTEPGARNHLLPDIKDLPPIDQLRRACHLLNSVARDLGPLFDRCDPDIKLVRKMRNVSKKITSRIDDELAKRYSSESDCP